MDGSLVVMEGSLLSRFLILQWMVALSLGTWSIVEIFVTPMDASLVIMEDSLLNTILLLQWVVALSLWKVVYCRDILLLQWMLALSLWKIVCCRDFYYSNGW